MESSHLIIFKNTTYTYIYTCIYYIIYIHTQIPTFWLIYVDSLPFLAIKIHPFNGRNGSH